MFKNLNIYKEMSTEDILNERKNNAMSRLFYTKNKHFIIDKPIFDNLIDEYVLNTTKFLYKCTIYNCAICYCTYNLSSQYVFPCKHSVCYYCYTNLVKNI